MPNAFRIEESVLDDLKKEVPKTDQNLTALFLGFIEALNSISNTETIAKAVLEEIETVEVMPEDYYKFLMNKIRPRTELYQSLEDVFAEIEEKFTLPNKNVKSGPEHHITDADFPENLKGIIIDPVFFDDLKEKIPTGDTLLTDLCSDFIESLKNDSSLRDERKTFLARINNALKEKEIPNEYDTFLVTEIEFLAINFGLLSESAFKEIKERYNLAKRNEKSGPGDQVEPEPTVVRKESTTAEPVLAPKPPLHRLSQEHLYPELIKAPPEDPELTEAPPEELSAVQRENNRRRLNHTGRNKVMSVA